jgi:ABC-2 type transport system permease protein
MTSTVDIITPAAAAPETEVAATLPWTRTFYWSVRRELWEHRAIYLAPLAVAAFAVIIHLLSALVIPHERGAILAHSAHGREFMGAYDALSGVIVIAALLVGVLYSAGALHGERRDRSILFWKSLPVSDTTAVLSKAAIPLLVLPVIMFVLVAAASALMITLQSAVWTLQGYDPRALWARLDLPFLWLALAYGLPFMALWYAPIYAWLLFVSSWAPRWPFLWAAAPLFAVLMVEHGALHNTSAHWMVERWLGGGVLQPYSVGGAGAVWIQSLADLEPARIYTLPQLWLGVAGAALLLAATVRMRRTRGAL